MASLLLEAEDCTVGNMPLSYAGWLNGSVIRRTLAPVYLSCRLSQRQP
jgi:hypothetical protein